MIKEILMEKHSYHFRLKYFKISCNLASNLTEEDPQWCSGGILDFVLITLSVPYLK